MSEDCSVSLEDLKKNYEILRKKYSLPNFNEMNRDFEIEKLQEKETETLSREIRRVMVDKNLAYLKFIEMFMNPSNAPMFFLALVKTLDSDSKKLLEELYKDLGMYEIKSIRLDNIYDEKKDAEFIKAYYKKWQDIKEKFEKIMKSVEDSWEKKRELRGRGISQHLGQYFHSRQGERWVVLSCNRCRESPAPECGFLLV